MGLGSSLDRPMSRRGETTTTTTTTRYFIPPQRHDDSAPKGLGQELSLTTTTTRNNTQDSVCSTTQTTRTTTNQDTHKINTKQQYGSSYALLHTCYTQVLVVVVAPWQDCTFRVDLLASWPETRRILLFPCSHTASVCLGSRTAQTTKSHWRLTQQEPQQQYIEQFGNRLVHRATQKNCWLENHSQ